MAKKRKYKNVNLVIDIESLRNDNNMFICPGCNNEFHKNGISIHIRNKHPELIDELCIEKRKNKLDHLKKENGNYECPYCKNEFSKYKIGAHLWTAHSHEEKYKEDFKWNKKRNEYRKCSKCKTLIKHNKYNIHVKICDGNIKHRIKINHFQKNGEKYICPFCSKEFHKKGIGKHIWSIHTKEGQSYISWAKGLTKDKDLRIMKISNKLIEAHQRNPWKIKAPKNINYTNNFFKNVKYYNYVMKNGKTIKLHGTYELRFARYLDKNNIEWEYEKPIYFYDDVENKKRWIYPDFYLPKINKYFDTKGLLSEESKRKYNLAEKQNNIRIFLIFGSELKKIENGDFKLEEINEDLF